MKMRKIVLGALVIGLLVGCREAQVLENEAQLAEAVIKRQADKTKQIGQKLKQFAGNDVERKKIKVCKAGPGPNGSQAIWCEQALPDVCKAIQNNINAYGGLYTLDNALTPINEKSHGPSSLRLEELSWKDLDFADNLQLVRTAASTVPKKEYAINRNYNMFIGLFNAGRYIRLQVVETPIVSVCDMISGKKCSFPLYRLIYEVEESPYRTNKYRLDGRDKLLQARYFFNPADLKTEPSPVRESVVATAVIRYGDTLLMQKNVGWSGAQQAYVYRLGGDFSFYHGPTSLTICAVILEK